MLLDEVAKLLDDNSTARTVGTNIFKGFAPPRAPDTCTFVYEYPGRSPQMVMGSSVPAYELPRIQIVERSTNYQTARSQAETWYRLVMGQVNTTLKPTTAATGANYLALSPLQSPFLMEIDENERFKIACNYEVNKALST